MAKIKTTLEASGVSQYKQQMSQATGAVKAMDAELKLAEAEFKATGDQAQYLATKSSLLKKQLEEQKKAVSAAEKALEQVKKQYGANSTQANTWRTNLAQAKTTLIQTETAIKATDTALDNLGKDDNVEGVVTDLGNVEEKAQDADTATKDLSTSMGNVSKKLDVKVITDGLDKITAGMEKVMQKAAQMGKAIWTASVDAANWADSTRDAAVQAHMTTEEYQRMAYAAQFFGTSVDQLVGKQAKLTTAMSKGGIIEIGDEVVDTMEWVMTEEGKYIQKHRSWSDVLMDSIEALSMITDETERDAAAQAIFGKSYSDLAGVIAAGREEWEARYNEAPVVGDDTVNSLADTADAVKDMNAELNTLKMELLAALAPSIQTIADAVGTLARKLTEFVQSEEGQRLLAQLGESIEAIVTALVDQDFDSIVEMATKAIQGLTEAFGWLAENRGAVVGAITAIATAFGGLKMISLGLKGMTFVNSLQNLLGKGTAGANAGADVAKNAGKATTAASGFGAKLGSTATNAWYTAGVPMAVLAAAIAPAVAAQNWDVQNRNQQITEQVAEASEAAAELGDAADQWMQIVNVAADAVGIDYNDRDIFGQVKLGDPARVMRGIQALAPYSDMLTEILSGSEMKELEALWYHPEDSTMNDAELDTLLTGTIGRITDHMRETGEDATGGLGEGMQAGEPELKGISEDLGWDIIFAVEDVLDINSPSRVMQDIGQNVGLGLAMGIDEGAKAAIASASSMAAAVASIVSSAMLSLNAAIASTSSYAGRGGGGYYDGSTTVNIGSYNQNGGGDMYALAGIVAAAQKQNRQGYGARR